MERAPRLAFVTCSRFPDLFEEERSLIPLLRAAGLFADAVVWSDPAETWRGFDHLVLRSTWDYVERIDAFRLWLAAVESSGVALHNQLALVRWNMDKHYLLALEAGGVRIAPTEIIEAGTRADLARVLAARGWTDGIIKPAISAAAYRTHRVDGEHAARHQGALDEILATGAALVQPFLPEICEQGEWSLFFFGGAFSHAVLKTPAAGDFRVQTQFGGAARRVSPAAATMKAARTILALLPARPLYARIDGVLRNGEFYLMELEAIEPYLFFAAAPDGMDRYVEAIVAAVKSNAPVRGDS